MSLPVSALLFSLLAVELSATVKKCIDEGYLAFLSPLIRSSKQQVLSERLEKLLKTRDAENLQVLLTEAGIINGTEQNLEDLETLELSIAKNFENHYNRILHYLPEDLKRFFEASKILWDVENMKLLWSHVLHETDAERQVNITGPFGHLDFDSIKSLAKSKSSEELFKNSIELLPTDFSSKMHFKEEWFMNDVELSLDLAAFEYLQEKSEEIGTQKARLAWSLMAMIYEVKNLIIMARLKYSGTSSENIIRFLFPIRNKLSESDIGRLLETESYSSFLEALRNTFYGQHIPTGEIDPMKVEDALKEGLQKFRFEETQADLTTEMIARFLRDCEAHYNTIRKAVFFTCVKGFNGG